MSHIIRSIEPDGAFIKAVVAVSDERWTALKEAGQTPPDPITLRALIDTGATSTCIDSHIITQMGITAKGIVPMHTPSTKGTPVDIEQYDVGIGIADQHGETKNRVNNTSALCAS